jgi:hypothetical protein
MLEDDEFLNCLVKREYSPAKPRVDGISKINDDIRSYLGILVDSLHLLHTSSIKKNLNIPIGPPASKKLLLYSCVHDPDEEDESKLIEESNTFDYEPILDIAIYVQLEEQLKKTKYSDNKYTSKQIEICHITHKLAFDCFNEGLDYERVFGIKGVSLPTKENKRNINTYISEHAANRIIDKCYGEVVRWSGFRCGTFLDIEKNFGMNFGSENEISDIIREQALMKHLEYYVGKQEEKWLDYDDDEIEVTLEISEMIFEALLDDCIYSLMTIHK